MNYIQVSFLCIFFLISQSCNSSTRTDLKKNDTKIKAIADAPCGNTPDTLLKHPGLIVIRHAGGHSDTLIKFQSPHRSVVVKKFTAKSARLKFVEGYYEPDQRAIIRKTVEREGANFAGHYTLVQWGCGSPCQISVVVDLKTGDIYGGPNSCYGYYFDVTSKILQINPPEYDSCWYLANRFAVRLHNICGTVKFLSY